MIYDQKKNIKEIFLQQKDLKEIFLNMKDYQRRIIQEQIQIQDNLKKLNQCIYICIQKQVKALKIMYNALSQITQNPFLIQKITNKFIIISWVKYQPQHGNRNQCILSHIQDMYKDNFYKKGNLKSQSQYLKDIFSISIEFNVKNDILKTIRSQRTRPEQGECSRSICIDQFEYEQSIYKSIESAVFKTLKYLNFTECQKLISLEFLGNIDTPQLSTLYLKDCINIMSFHPLTKLHSYNITLLTIIGKQIEIPGCYKQLHRVKLHNQSTDPKKFLMVGTRFINFNELFKIQFDDPKKLERRIQIICQFFYSIKIHIHEKIQGLQFQHLLRLEKRFRKMVPQYLLESNEL